MSGLNGVRQLMVLYVPLLAAVLAVIVWHIRAERSASLREAARACPQVFRMLGGTLLFTACSGAGYLFNLSVLLKKYTFSAYDAMKWKSPYPSLFERWREFMLMFGYQPGQLLFSVGGIASGLGLLLGAAVLVSLVRLCLRFGRLEPRHQVIVAFLLSGLLVCGVVFCYLGVYEPNYWLPLLPFGLVVLLLEISTEDFCLSNARRVLVCFVAVSISLCSIATVRQEISAPLRGRPGLDAVTDWLLEQGYTGGYAYFWTGQAVTELSDGQIEMWTISETGSEIYGWLQKTDHTSRLPDPPYFLLLDLLAGESPVPFGGTEVYRDDRYVVLEFTDPYAMQNAMAQLPAQRAGSE